MKPKNVFLRRLSLWVFFSVIFLGLILGASYCFGLKVLEKELMVLNTIENATAQEQVSLQKILLDLNQSMLFILPIFFVTIGFLGILFRWILGRSFRKHSPALDTQKSPGPKGKQKPTKMKEKIIYKVDKNKETLLYSHLLAAFQREGQWIDFLNEKLDQYEDAQIGAAVRNIQENCKKVLNTHMQLKPILGQAQGEDIILEEGFSPDTIKLVGNVKGSPPFKGVIRHKGWKIQKVDIPDFSGEQNLEVLAPAEVEIK